MKKQHRRALLTLGAVYLATLIYLAPASLAGRLVHSLSAGQVLLANGSGTLWKGRATPVIQARSGESIALTPLHWQMDLSHLYRAELGIRIDWEDEPQEQPMRIRLTPQEMRIEQLYLPLSATLIGAVSDFIRPAGLRGRILVRGEALSYGKDGWNGQARAEWLHARSLLSRVAPLGNYRLDFQVSRDRLEIGLATLSGALLLAGRGNLQAGSGLVFNGTAQAAPGNEDALNELLGHLGPEVRPGVRGFSLLPAQ